MEDFGSIISPTVSDAMSSDSAAVYNPWGGAAVTPNTAIAAPVADSPDAGSGSIATGSGGSWVTAAQDTLGKLLNFQLNQDALNQQRAIQMQARTVYQPNGQPGLVVGAGAPSYAVGAYGNAPPVGMLGGANMLPILILFAVGYAIAQAAKAA